MDGHWTLALCIFALLGGVYAIGLRHGADFVYWKVARFQDRVERRRR